MTTLPDRPLVLPYSLVVGQTELRRALEVSFVDPGLGVLATGMRGTAKSTTIRAFSIMAFSELPTTLPIGASDDRVLGGLSIEALLRNRHEWQPGLLEQASASAGRMLFIDEVNLLDDHLVNVILDAASTGILVVQRDNVDHGTTPVRFSLIGTMNPDEGGLRPQLLDRFGLVVEVDAEGDVQHRRQVLETVLRFEEECENTSSEFLSAARTHDAARRRKLIAARDRRHAVSIRHAAEACARIAVELEVVGHRGELTLIRAARAVAALDGAPAVGPKHLRTAARMALVHRRPSAQSGTLSPWLEEDDRRIAKVVTEMAKAW
ncbi:AAA family ATPase [Micromonospora sp. NPDC047793]|uniref:AAA family ATPase n=1 Tax=Micromonospora sp. NPDC047793 TaxID=3154342 RepID=UPI0033DB5459